MGVARRTVAPVGAALKAAAAAARKPNEITARAAVPLNPGLVPIPPQQPYEIYAREGYSQNELVFACVQCLATSAAEPVVAAYKGNGKQEKQLDQHEVLTLLNRPNKWLSPYQFIAGIVAYRSLAGNVYIEKVRSRAGKVVELWLLRPDRVHILADPDTYISGYRYQIGGHWWDIPPEDLIHLRSFNPLDDHYGMPPLMPVAGRVDIDNWSRAFIAAFFRNGGVPAGLLKVKRPLEEEEREVIRARFRGEYGGPAGWHNLAIIDLEGADAEFQAAGLPMGDRGLAMPELNFISEARIAGAFGVPLSLVQTVLGMKSSSYANREADEDWFWRGTLAPLYREVSDGLTMGLLPDFPGLDRIGFDMSTVRALQEDDDKKHDRLRKDMAAGGITQEEFRKAAGYDDKINPNDTYVVTSSLLAMPVDKFVSEEEDPDTEVADVGESHGIDPNAPPTQAKGDASTQAKAPAPTGDEVKLWASSIETKSENSGLMVCCYVPADLAQKIAMDTDSYPGALAPADHHVTLAYVSNPTPDHEQAALAVAHMVSDHLPIEAKLSGAARFAAAAGEDPYVALVDSPALHELQKELVQHLQRASVPVSTEHAFTPHVTLAYLSKEDPTPTTGPMSEPMPLRLETIAVKRGDGAPILVRRVGAPTVA